jgi:hypothetical protein
LRLRLLLRLGRLLLPLRQPRGPRRAPGAAAAGAAARARALAAAAAARRRPAPAAAAVEGDVQVQEYERRAVRLQAAREV